MRRAGVGVGAILTYYPHPAALTHPNSIRCNSEIFHDMASKMYLKYDQKSAIMLPAVDFASTIYKKTKKIEGRLISDSYLGFFILRLFIIHG